MTRKVVLILIASLITAVAIGWAIVTRLPRRSANPVTAAPAATTPPLSPVIDGRKIKARLFFVSEDGSRLTSIEHEVPYAERTEMQARRILEAQFAPAAAPLVSAIPQGTTVRAVFLTPDGTAFVDISGELSSKHPGGSLNELLTVYTIVEALTTNLPAVTAVQVLVDGKELDTLAGHLDMKHPLPRGDEWVVESPAATR